MDELRKIFSRRLTFVVDPGAAQKTRQWKLPAGILYAVGALAMIALVGNVFFGASFVDQKISSAEYERLKSENLELSKKLEELRWELSDLNVRYDELTEKEVAIRQMFDLPEIDPEQRMLGVGGPTDQPGVFSSHATALAYHNEAEIDRLNRLARFEVSKFDEVIDALEAKKQKLNHTPSILPAKGWLSRGMGMKPNPFTGQKQFHAGIDIANHTGTPVVATADGTVRFAGRNGGMGRMITINHGYGIKSRYGHLSKILVKRGKKVKRGDVIGLMGSTGYSTGPHLHYEVHKNGKTVNPYRYIIKQNY